MTLSATLEAALIGQATKQDVIQAIDAELAQHIHEMTLPEYVQFMKGKRVEHGYYNRQGQLIQNHMNAVLHALQLGKSVPVSVIESMPYPLPQWAKK